ncbi:MAG: dihydrofolate reductase family protein [Cyanobacteriota bacterium]|nr:dihydrofolate reductase family protein [Cyanobacteriota bacterium]
MLAISLDGRLAPREGGAAQLGGAGDRRVLEEALGWADAVLLGAQTLRLHRTSCLIHAPDLLRHRQRLGLSPQPLVVVWSRSGQISGELPFFQQPFDRWLLLSDAASKSAATLKGFSTVLPFEDWPKTLAQLGALGLRRVTVLGGARLAAALVAAKALDELQLTLCPVLLGGGKLWLPPESWSDPSLRWHLQRHQSLVGGEHLLHYTRQPAETI